MFAKFHERNELTPVAENEEETIASHTPSNDVWSSVHHLARALPWLPP